MHSQNGALLGAPQGAGSSGEAGFGQEGSFARALAANPFVMPTDEEVFKMRDEEKRRKRQERSRLTKLSVEDKTTFTSRMSYNPAEVPTRRGKAAGAAVGGAGAGVSGDAGTGVGAAGGAEAGALGGLPPDHRRPEALCQYRALGPSSAGTRHRMKVARGLRRPSCPNLRSIAPPSTNCTACVRKAAWPNSERDLWWPCDRLSCSGPSVLLSGEHVRPETSVRECREAMFSGVAARAVAVSALSPPGQGAGRCILRVLCATLPLWRTSRFENLPSTIL